MLELIRKIRCKPACVPWSCGKKRGASCAPDTAFGNPIRLSASYSPHKKPKVLLYCSVAINSVANGARKEVTGIARFSSKHEHLVHINRKYHRNITAADLAAPPP